MRKSGIIFTGLTLLLAFCSSCRIEKRLYANGYYIFVQRNIQEKSQPLKDTGNVELIRRVSESYSDSNIANQQFSSERIATLSDTADLQEDITCNCELTNISRAKRNYVGMLLKRTDSTSIYDTIFPIKVESQTIKLGGQYLGSDTSSTRTTYDWMLPIGGIAFSITSALALANGLYVLAIVAFIASLFLVIFGYIRITQYSRRRKSTPQGTQKSHRWLTIVALSLNILNSLFLIALGWLLGFSLFCC